MAVLVDFQLRDLCINQKLLDPFDHELINPASIDVRIGITAKVETADGWTDLDLTQYSVTNPYLMQPKEFLLVATWETFNLPATVCGEFRLKSSRAREGYNNNLAVWLDPLWHGSKLTLELINESRFRSLPLYPGLKIGQAVFFDCLEPEKTYALTGRYNNDHTVMGSKG